MALVKLILILGFLGLIGGLAYIRLAPSDVSRWHDIEVPRDAAPGQDVVAGMGEAHLAMPVDAVTPENALRIFDEIALASPRTQRLAGTPATGKVTYVTRSLVFGFPDYTTVAASEQDGQTWLFAIARLRFGKSDMGVNAARLTAWRDALRERLQ